MNKRADIFVVAFALFAMFVGAGNIIFPFYIGAGGENFLISSISFILSAVGLPIISFLTVAKSGGEADNISDVISPNFSKALTIIILITVGPLLAIPRTAATTYELSIIPFLNNDELSVRIITSLLFFIFCIYFVVSPKKVIDRIGKYLTPIIVIFSLLLIILSLVNRNIPDNQFTISQGSMNSVGVPISKTFLKSFSMGYQTMDALAAIVFSGTIYATLIGKGFPQSKIKTSLIKISLITASALIILYLGLMNIGHIHSADLKNIESKTALTTKAVELVTGRYGKAFLAIIILFACTTTAIGLIVTASRYFHKLFAGKISYRQVVIIISLVSFIISIIGVEGILKLASPILEIIYPIVVVLVLLNLFGENFRRKNIYISAILITVPFSIMNIMRSNNVGGTADSILKSIPLGDIGLAYILPFLLYVTAVFIYVKLSKEN